jgi:hypothetical protein
MLYAVKILYSIILVGVFVVWTIICVQDTKDYIKRRNKKKNK